MRTFCHQSKWVGVWLAIGLLMAAIGLSGFNQSALAAPKQVNYTLNVVPGQTFTELMQQAQAQARSLIDQAFSDASITTVRVNILGERNGQEAPLLQSTVSRTDWQRNPNLAKWTTYFGTSSVVLLGFTPPRGAPAASSPTPAQPSIAPPTPAIAPAAQPNPTLPNPPSRRRQIEDDPGFRDD